MGNTKIIKITHIVGTRPNFVKIAPIVKELKQYNNIDQLLIHTGQHYDELMSNVFFKQFNISIPIINLNIKETNNINFVEQKIRYEIQKFNSDLTIVPGDVNSSLAGAIAAKKSNSRVIHLEAGLRSFDLTMPEEINRILIDKLSDKFLIYSQDAFINLINENFSEEDIFDVGNIMIDSLVNAIPIANSINILDNFNLIKNNYSILTLHRQSNVDNEKYFFNIIKSLKELTKLMPIIFPVHPRTKLIIQKNGFNYFKKNNIILSEPLGYFEFLSLMLSCKYILTDSGGIQEESSFLNIPCLTIRDNTERPITITHGTNQLIGTKQKTIKLGISQLLNNNIKKSNLPKFWDGKTSNRIANLILEGKI